MLDHNCINKNILKNLFSNSNKYIFLIDRKSKILDFSENFTSKKEKFTHLTDLITYTHSDHFLNEIESLDKNNNLLKFTTNFSFNKADVTELPDTFEIILYLQEDQNILVVADPKPALSNHDAKMYLSLVNDFSKSSRELNKTKKNLKKLNDTLQQEIDNAVLQIRKKDEMLLKTAKDAAMGEMIDSIAHQWKGPLNAIGLVAQGIQLDYELFGEIDIQKTLSNATVIENQVEHLINTINEFRTFFRPNIKTQLTMMEDVISSVTTLMKDEILKKRIHIDILGDKSLQFVCNPNHFKHVLINFISNSIDSFEEKSIENRNIIFTLINNSDNLSIKYTDNAGGIPDDIINNVFEANFTTKKNGKGTGIGLYLVKQIIDKMSASIKVKNITNKDWQPQSKGIEFTINFNH